MHTILTLAIRMHIILRSIYHVALCIAVLPQVFSSTVKERIAANNARAGQIGAIDVTKKPNRATLTGKRDANAVLGNSVKDAETATTRLFTQHYNEAARDATYAKRQQINLWRIKKFQALHTTPAFFDTSTTGVKARPERFQPTLDASNLAMAAAYAPYNNVSRVSKEDVEAFARAYPQEVTGLNLQALEGDLLPQNAAGQAFAYNPFSYGMVLVYRLRHQDKLGGESPTTIDIYNKDAAFQWESAAGIAHEAIGTAHTASAPTTKSAPTSSAHAHITQKIVEDARKKLKPIAAVA